MRYITKRLFWIVVSGIIYSSIFHGSAFLDRAGQALSHLSASPISTAQARPAPLSGQAGIEVGFSPGNAQDVVVQAIGKATRSIEVAAYSFTSAPIAKALVQASRRGVAVRVVLDKSQRSARYSSATFLANAGVPVRINTRYAIMHNKFLVIDGATVQTGSFNYTSSAHKRNAENVLILRNAPAVARTYTAEWNRLWSESTAYAARN